MQAAFKAVGEFNDRLQEQGRWVFGCGLMPVETATVAVLCMTAKSERHMSQVDEPNEGPNAAAVVIISHALWNGAFSADPTILGKTMSINGQPHTIIGVMRSPVTETTEVGGQAPANAEVAEVVDHRAGGVALPVLVPGDRRAVLEGRGAPGPLIRERSRRPASVCARSAGLRPG